MSIDTDFPVLQMEMYSPALEHVIDRDGPAELSDWSDPLLFVRLSGESGKRVIRRNGCQEIVRVAGDSAVVIHLEKIRVQVIRRRQKTGFCLFLDISGSQELYASAGDHGDQAALLQHDPLEVHGLGISFPGGAIHLAAADRIA